ncbi:DegT/DnrJ/EryC1/StrS family aminotransferase [Roseimaritima sediminicola]|uniref:DegT/DnrJ/EryC1/StrS family aminotransferase n=1 Tax=Roseimaritima sediminicola TaxID=2662066 RepID=UPI0012982927|nr:DegT/DnrJ/EryC1/StrS family aminotransferase [Roseimaritima sediminicola]
MKTESREQLQSWLRDTLPQQTPTNPRYWFPLTLPTYGVDEISEAIECMVDFQTSMGQRTRQFEQAFANYVGAADAVMVNSGSSADLLLAYQLINPLNPRLQPGDEVLVPVVTWPTQVWSVAMAGLKVQLVDVDPTTLNVDLDDLRRRIGPRTKCFFAVHLMGNPCAMDAVRKLCNEYGLLLIEDCCEALGAQHDGQHVGTFGLGGSYSFFFSHHMTTMEGGMVTCVDQHHADQLRVLRAHGWSRGLQNQATGAAEIDSRYLFVNWGFNLRPTELQAAFGLHQLAKLDAMNARRRQLAARFEDYVAQRPALATPSVPAAGTSSPFALPVMLSGDLAHRRGELTDYLEQQGIETRPVVAGNLARQPAAAILGDLDPTAYRGADEIHQRGFYLGLNPAFDDVLFGRMLDTLDAAIDHVSSTTHVRTAA